MPTFKKEADEVVRQVEVLGKDPLTVMQQRAETTGSKLYRNFLGGFVSSVRSGGKMVDYMKSQLKAIFELRYINLNRSIEKIATLVEAYSVMLIVVLCYLHPLCCFIIDKRYVTLGGAASIASSPLLSYLIAFIVMPVLSCIFIMMAHNMQQSAFPDLSDLYKKAINLHSPRIRGDCSLCNGSFTCQQAVSPIGLPAIATLCLSWFFIANCDAVPENLKNQLQRRRIPSKLHKRYN